MLHFNAQTKGESRSVVTQQSSVDTPDDEPEVKQTHGSRVRPINSRETPHSEIKSTKGKVKIQISRSDGKPQKQGNCSSNPKHVGAEAIKSSCSDEETEFSYRVSLTGGILLATAVIKVRAPNGIESKALLDSCSQVSIITESLAQRLKSKTQRVKISLEGSGDTPLGVVNNSADVIIKPYFNRKFENEVNVLVMQQVSSYKAPFMSTAMNLSHIKGLKLADPWYMDSSHIDVLLGASAFLVILKGKVREGSRQKPKWVLKIPLLTQCIIVTTAILIRRYRTFGCKRSCQKRTLSQKMNKSAKSIFAKPIHKIAKEELFFVFPSRANDPPKGMVSVIQSIPLKRCLLEWNPDSNLIVNWKMLPVNSLTNTRN